MASLESLPADQRAVLQLVLQRGRGYDQIARLLSMDRGAVRQRAIAALGALGPDTGLADDRRELISDYLLGQLEPEDVDAVRDAIGSSPADRAWARVVASELGPLVSRPLPEIPNGPVPHATDAATTSAPAAPPYAEPFAASPPAATDPRPAAVPPSPPEPPPSAALSSGRRRREPLFLGRRGGGAPEAKPPREKKAREPRFLGRPRGGVPSPPPAVPAAGDEDASARRSSRLGGVVLILLTVIIVAAIAVILLNRSGSANPPVAHTPATSSSAPASPSASASATTGGGASTTTASSSGSAKIVAQINLTPPSASSKAAGIAEILKEGASDGIAIVAQHVTPNTTKPPNAYAVWLYNSSSDAHLLGFVNPGVGSTGRLSTAGGLPANAAHYKQLIVTLESKASPTTPGQIILQGTLSGL